MQTFVINLKRNPKRKEQVVRQLNALKLPHTIFTATDGKTKDEAGIEEIYDREKSLEYLKSPLRTNEIACAHSHQQIYKEIIKQDLPFALILEDDVVLNSKLPKFLSTYETCQAKADWLQLDYPQVGWSFLKNWLRGSWTYTKRNPLFAFYALVKLPYISILCIFESIREKLYKNNPTIVTFARPLYYASAYVVTKAGAEKLLSISDKIIFAADMLPNKARVQKKLIMKAVTPRLAQQDKKFISDVSDKSA